MINQKNTKQQYEKLVAQLKEIEHLSQISRLLSWDMEVMMPTGSSDSRSNQSQVLAGIIHDKKTSKELGEILNGLFINSETKSELNPYEWANVRDAYKNYKKETCIPKELSQKCAKFEIEAHPIWVQAKKENKWELFAPVLENWVQLRKEICALIDPTKPAYDVCIDDFEREMTAERLSEVFQELKPHIIDLISKIKQKDPIDDSWLTSGKFDVKKQTEFCHTVAKDIGFDLNCGRLDVSVHPFTGGPNPTDVRMTTRYSETNLIEGLTGTIHETGHSLYEQGRNKEYCDLPVSEALSMGIHESQSLLWERMVGLSKEFLYFYYPTMKEIFQLPDSKSVEDFYRSFNVVKPSLIRVEADEVTYFLHIVIRFEIEKELFDGKISVSEIPDLWQKKLQSYLGIQAPDNSTGCLQDIHWACGLFGYFPTYSLGAIYGCQFFDAARKEIKDLDQSIAKGDFSPLKKWLNENIHTKGSSFSTGEQLLKEVTHKEIDVKLFVNYLNKKYSEIYKLDQ